jgi:hypothetical protein
MKRHSTDGMSLVFGVVFILIALWWVLGWYGLGLHINIPNLGLIAAGALILLGLAGIFGSLRRDREPVSVPAATVPAATLPAATAPPEEPTLIDTVPEDDRPE